MNCLKYLVLSSKHDRSYIISAIRKNNRQCKPFSGYYFCAVLRPISSLSNGKISFRERCYSHNILFQPTLFEKTLLYQLKCKFSSSSLTFSKRDCLFKALWLSKLIKYFSKFLNEDKNSSKMDTLSLTQ